MSTCIDESKDMLVTRILGDMKYDTDAHLVDQLENIIKHVDFSKAIDQLSRRKEKGKYQATH